MKIKTREEQALDHFLKTCEELQETVMHSDPRMESDGYTTTTFNKKKAKKLFYTLKDFFTTNQ